MVIYNLFLLKPFFPLEKVNIQLRILPPLEAPPGIKSVLTAQIWPQELYCVILLTPPLPWINTQDVYERSAVAVLARRWPNYYQDTCGSTFRCVKCQRILQCLRSPRWPNLHDETIQTLSPNYQFRNTPYISKYTINILDRNICYIILYTDKHLDKYRWYCNIL